MTLSSSPLAPGVSPVSIHYREWGSGRPLLLLHGGWGQAIYPFDPVAGALGDRFHVCAPDRSGYGGSGRIATLAATFHHHAMAETFALMDALGWPRAAVWGHSDGAVIAALMALEHPERIDRIVLEAFHLYRRKPASRAFFAACASGAPPVDARVAGTLASEHGSSYWRTLLRLHGQAWLDLADQSPAPDADLYGGRLSTVRVPVLLLHGRQDPRTEPGEIDAVCRALPHARLAMLDAGAHSPHSERAVAGEAIHLAAAFLTEGAEAHA